ncbi:MAG: hypothetical protein HGA65_00690 [Oscillochloris sp.]|nr:hypothetical protein [Oscillochloris sp.]
MVTSYPLALRQLCAPTLETLLGGEFSQIAALLPLWLSDLIPLSEPLLDELGEAGLWLWWYASVLDSLVDGDVAPTALPGAQQALLRALEIYRGLGLAETPAWADLQARALRAADAYAREVATRSIAINALQDDQLALWSSDLLVDRASPFLFTLSAQLELVGAPAADPQRAQLAAVLSHLTAMRQLADDASDWLADLQRGQLNSASAGLIRYFRQQRPDQAATLSVEQLAGYEIHAEDYWRAMEQQYQQLYQQALDHLADSQVCRLGMLIRHQKHSDQIGWERMRARRATLRLMFCEIE